MRFRPTATIANTHSQNNMDQLPSIIDRLGEAKLEDIDDVEAEARRLSNDPGYLQILNSSIKSARIREGGYYSTFQDLFATQRLKFNQTDVNEFVRTRRPKCYDVLAGKLDDASEIGRFHIARTADSTITVERRIAAFPTDIFGNSGTGELAHLIPDSPVCSLYFVDVGIWVLPLDEIAMPGADELETKRRKMVINGFKKTNRSNKVADSSLKRSLLNRIRLRLQGHYLDRHPCVLIIPLVDTEFLRNWDDGIEYEALILVSEDDTTDERIPADQVFRDIGLTRKLPECEPREIHMATTLLATAMKALAVSMSTKPKKHFEASTTYRNELVSTYEKIQVEGTIAVPALVANAANTARVAKVKFGAAEDPVFHHIAVDPTLLLMKTAAVASAQVGERLLPACPPLEDWTAEDDMQARRYLAEKQARTTIPAEIQISIS